MVVQHNMQAMNANRMLNVTTGAQGKSTEKLSSGYKINRAADDAAGLSISEKMRRQIRGLDRASSNAQDGISSVQTAEGALTEVHDMLQRMNELANQASNGTNSLTDREAIQGEIDQLTTEIDRVAETTKFNELYLLKGDPGTKEIKLKAHDAGIDGRLSDQGETATFTATLVTDSDVSIAGKNYHIYEDDDKLDAFQEQVDSANTVMINGTTYTKDPSHVPASAADVAAKRESANEKLASATALDTESQGLTSAANTLKDSSNTLKSSANDLRASAATLKASAAALKASSELKAASSKVKGASAKVKGASAAVKGASAAVKQKSADTLNASGDAKTLNASTKLATASARLQLLANATTTTSVTKLQQSADKLIASATLLLTQAAAKYSAGSGLTSAANTLNASADTLKASVSTLEASAATLEASSDTKAASSDAKSASVNVKSASAQVKSASASTKKASANAKTEEAGEKTAQADTLRKLSDSLNKAADEMENEPDSDPVFLSNGKEYRASELKAKIVDGAKVSIDGETARTAVDTINNKSNKTMDDIKGMIKDALKQANQVGVDDAKDVAVSDAVKTGNEYTYEITKGSVTVAKDMSFNLHVGADADLTNKITVNIETMNSKNLGVNGIQVADDSGVAATYAIDAIEDAIQKVNEQRSALGAVQNRLEHTITNLDNVVENTQSAESQIRDTDIADEMVRYSKNNILSQAGQSMLAQANQSTQGALSLLG